MPGFVYTDVAMCCSNRASALNKTRLRTGACSVGQGASHIVEPTPREKHDVQPMQCHAETRLLHLPANRARAAALRGPSYKAQAAALPMALKQSSSCCTLRAPTTHSSSCCTHVGLTHSSSCCTHEGPHTKLMLLRPDMACGLSSS